MANEPYRSARLKLKRARRHIEELQQIIDGYSGAEIAPEQSGNSRVTWRLRIREDPKDDVETILGDAIHNLRVSLDHTAVEAVRLNGKNVKDVYFPFAADGSQLEIMIKKRNFHRASDAAIDLIRSLKPYSGGNAALRAIHDLDIADKHRSLVEFAGSAKQSADLQVGGALLSGNSFSLVDGMGLVDAPLVPLQAYKPIPIHLVATIALGQPLGGSEVLPTLTSLSELVDGIVEAFAALR